MKVLTESRILPATREVAFKLPEEASAGNSDYAMVMIPKSDNWRLLSFKLHNISQRGEMICFFVAAPAVDGDAEALGLADWESRIGKIAREEEKTVEQVKRELLSAYRSRRFLRDGRDLGVLLEKALIEYDAEARRASLIRLNTGQSVKQKIESAVFDDRKWGLRITDEEVQVRPRKHGGGRKAQCDLSYLARYYNSLLPQCQDAQQMCKDALKAKTDQRKKLWRETIKLSYPDFPDYILDILQHQSKLSEHQLERAREQGHYQAKHGWNAPENIALEYAACKCGADKFQFKTGYLRKRKTRTGAVDIEITNL